MVYIPYSPENWSRIEKCYRAHHPGDHRKKLPIREVADWWAVRSDKILQERGF